MKPFKAQRSFWRIVEFIPQVWGFSNSPMENDSAPIIILELFTQTVFSNANKNCNDNGDCQEWDTHISCKSTLFE